MKPLAKVTVTILIVTLVLLVAWDIIAIALAGEGVSISYWLTKFAKEHYSLPFIAGALLGHWFWPRERALFGYSGMDSFVRCGLPILAVVVLSDVFITSGYTLMPYMPVIGYFIGHFIWPQRKR